MNQKRRFLLFSSLLLAGCGAGSDKKKAADEDTSIDHHTVIVLDDGFDTSHDVFQGKIAATYTITCDKDKQDEIDVSASFDDQKKAMIAAYQSTKSPCSVAESINFVPAADYASVTQDRESWNAQVQAKALTFDDAKIESLRKIIGGTSANVNYHGTNTAGLIAYQNPDVKLVLIQYDLRTPNEGAVESPDDCPKQAEIDAWVKLHGDSDVLAAYMAAPLDEASAKLLKIQVEQKATLANLSLGTPPRIELEKELADEGCGTLNFLEYYKLEGKIEREREQLRASNGTYAGTEQTLTVQAAGNSGAQIDGDADAQDCGEPTLGTVMVGAVDFAGKRASFSNFGQCVQYYMMGDRVIVPAPGQFLDITSGTSFSAPLTVRLLALQSKPDAPFQDKQAVLAGLAGSGGVLATATYPNELAFDDTKDKITAYALAARPVNPAYSAHRLSRLTHPGALK